MCTITKLLANMQCASGVQGRKIYEDLFHSPGYDFHKNLGRKKEANALSNSCIGILSIIADIC